MMLKYIKSGFTLAEILITLGIVVVISALVIPGLLTAYKKHMTVIKVREAYSIFSQVIKRSVLDNGDVSGWDLSGGSAVVPEIYLIPYIQGVSKIPVDIIQKKGNELVTLSTAGGGGNIYHGAPSYHGNNTAYYLPNGMSFNLYMYGGALDIVVDINGLTNKPNILGIDGFVFQIDKEKSVVRPKCHSGETMHGKCIRDDNFIYYRGYCCAAMIEKNGWRISKDYPWGNGGR